MAQATGTATGTGTGTRQQSDGGDELVATTPTDDENLFINPTDGLPNEHPALPSAYDSDSESNAVADDDLLDDLPTSIIVTNIHSEVFADDGLKASLEELFRTFSDNTTFQWLKSFRRLRVNYDSALAAANARIRLHQYPFGKSVINCYLAQPVTPVSNTNLKPPAPVKQFLISPPASPPAGWEPAEEGEPLVNHDLLAALASLTPGESHEIHAQSEHHPGIILHTAAEQLEAAAAAAAAAAGEDETAGGRKSSSMGSSFEDEDPDKENSPVGGGTNVRKARIMQTRCPERKSST
ncbi:protein sarah [Anopheles merus]|uniref:Protein sarah n=1 Tax=Anopheles merus TaxID=30066 RepID=A0A182V3F5_ANOME|nr:protein sarah [Anopheles merus]XP_041767871.1 protein sarah [Anopheles merus]XP_041767873.1 protein sarah [Anopheles merus]XP_041767874.1 protein sarah [Anopheles merus]